ncbi:protein YgfX [Neisseria leonii]|uniref:Protein YgfX n=1 Tax=Neisseria leonii TaxID=2995413 RepID=A0A9X4E453_9NEIS|nr:protein YgfX [Neisseria sp. 51.81]MDD9327661.1 transcriptional regulator [Neisseria sp. 51.81]
MQPFRAEFRPSRRAAWLAVSLHTLAAGMLPFLHGYQLGAAAVLLPLSAAYAWRVRCLRHRNAVAALVVDTAGRAQLYGRDGRKTAAWLRPGSLVHRQCCLLDWQTESGRIRQQVWPDMTDADSYRRLLVWARFVPPDPAAVRQEQSFITGVFRRPRE